MKKVAALSLFVFASIFAIGIAGTQPPEVRIASYTTPLEGRLDNQRHNAELALEKIRGAIIQPGEEFSFNERVRTWSRDQGYKKAPVSFNGTLIPAFGGGVCQTSTTLYNAAALAGLEITERHRHRFAPNYVPPGRDAAVAYSNIDLRFKNPYPWPVRLEARIEDNRLVCEVYGSELPRQSVTITQETRDVREPKTLRDGGGPSGRVLNPGKAGYSVATYRLIGGRRELLSEDVYPPMHRVVSAR